MENGFSEMGPRPRMVRPPSRQRGAGDCTGAPLQVSKAVGEGHVAALSACEYLDRLD